MHRVLLLDLIGMFEHSSPNNEVVDNDAEVPGKQQSVEHQEYVASDFLLHIIDHYTCPVQTDQNYK